MSRSVTQDMWNSKNVVPTTANNEEETLAQKLERNRQLAAIRSAAQAQNTATPTAATPTATPVATTPTATPAVATAAKTKAPVFGSKEYGQQQGAKASSAIGDLMAHLQNTKAPETPTYTDLEANAPQMSDYQYNSDFMDKYLEKPLTQDEIDRRTRGAYVAKGVSDMGNALGALGNLFFVGGGAAPQTLPTSPDVDAKVNAMKERADKVRTAYINGKLAGRQADLAEYNNARNYNLELNKGKNALAQQGFNDRMSVYNADTNKTNGLIGANQGLMNSGMGMVQHADQLAENEKNRAIEQARLAEQKRMDNYTITQGERAYNDAAGVVPVQTTSGDANSFININPKKITSLNKRNLKQHLSDKGLEDWNDTQKQIDILTGLYKQEVDKAEEAQKVNNSYGYDTATSNAKNYQAQLAALYDNELRIIGEDVLDNKGLSNYLVSSGIATRNDKTKETPKKKDTL